MIARCKEEEQQDIDQRDWCKETTFTKETDRDRHKYKIQKTEAKITKLTEKKEELENSIANTDAEILATHEELDAATATREEENGAFLQAKSDDEQAAALLGVAIGHLSAFYTNEGVDQGSLQLLQQPE